MSPNNKPETYSPFLSWAQCNEIVERVWGLIDTFNALPRFREQLKEWAAHCEGVQKKRDEWEKKRLEHEQHTLTQRRLLDEDAGPPDDGWRFEEYRLHDTALVTESTRITSGLEPVSHIWVPPEPLLGAWFPPELRWDNCPPGVCLPLPVPTDRPVLLHEMYAGLSAICDDDSGEERELEDGDSTRTDQKINEWINDDPLDDESSVELLKREMATISRYSFLMDCVRGLPKSDRRKLNRWVEKIEADLKERAPQVRMTPAGEDDPPAGYIFRLSGNMWHLKFGNEEGTFHNTKGLQRIHTLLEKPDTAFLGLTLCSGDSRCSTLTHSIAETSDQEALDAYHHQIEELDEEFEQAKKHLDHAAQDRCSEDKQKLLAQMSLDTRHDGRTRLLGDSTTAKRALLAAQATIRDVLKELRKAELINMAEHLHLHIKAENHSLTYQQPSPEFSWTL